MNSSLIHDRGRGPELKGTRVTVYNLLTSFLDPTFTEAEICRIYDLTPEQVAAARSYILSNPETVLAEHLRIEEWIASGVKGSKESEEALKAKETFRKFKQWLSEQESWTATGETEQQNNGPTFREWLRTESGL
jgi:uncharacterized protein (DUF433 family)